MSLVSMITSGEPSHDCFEMLILIMTTLLFLFRMPKKGAFLAMLLLFLFLHGSILYHCQSSLCRPPSLIPSRWRWSRRIWTGHVSSIAHMRL
jgi:hypothetical protein